HLPPRSPPFPYTTLFRSAKPTSSISIFAFARTPQRLSLRAHESSQDLFWPKQNSPEKISGLRVFDFPDYRLRSRRPVRIVPALRSEEHTSELQSPDHLVC